MHDAEGVALGVLAVGEVPDARDRPLRHDNGSSCPFDLRDELVDVGDVDAVDRTGLAFAAAVFNGKRELAECPHLEGSRRGNFWTRPRRAAYLCQSRSRNHVGLCARRVGWSI